MSKEIFETDGLYVTRHAGPLSEGEDRARWQFTPTNGDGYATLTRRQVRTLIVVLLRDAWRVPRQAEDA
jgi:hypothetical protein